MHMERRDTTCVFFLHQTEDDYSHAIEHIQDHLVESDLQVRLDLDGVSQLRSPDLAAMVALHKQLSCRGKHLQLHRPNEHTRRLLQVTRLDQVLDIA